MRNKATAAIARGDPFLGSGMTIPTATKVHHFLVGNHYSVIDNRISYSRSLLLIDIVANLSRLK